MSWKTDPAGPKQRYWIERNLTERKLGIALTDQANAALKDDNLTKGEASELLDAMFAKPKKDDGPGQGVYILDDGGAYDNTVVIVKPNQKYLENPKQPGANLYSMSLVPAPGTEGKVRFELVYDPEARIKLAEHGIKVTEEAQIAAALKCAPARVAKKVRELL